MKRTITTLLLILGFVLANAQDPEFSYDFIHNRALLNPAYSGKITYITFNLTMNRQWLFPEAPQHSTLWFSTHFNRMGVGAQVSVSNTAQFYKMMMGLNYFYDLLLDYHSRTHLSFGVSAGLFQDYINTAQTQTLEPDPLLQDQRAFSRFYPQLAVGAMLYNDFYEFGISGTRLLPYSGYFFLDHDVVLPPVLIVHGAYFYKHPIELYTFTSEAAAFVSKDFVYLRPNITFYLRKVLKVGGGISGKYVFDVKTAKLNLHLIAGLKIAGKFYVTYEATIYSINQPVPAMAKLGNTLSLRYDFYPFEKDVPRFF